MPPLCLSCATGHRSTENLTFSLSPMPVTFTIHVTHKTNKQMPKTLINKIESKLHVFPLVQITIGLGNPFGTGEVA